LEVSIIKLAASDAVLNGTSTGLFCGRLGSKSGKFLLSSPDSPLLAFILPQLNLLESFDAVILVRTEDDKSETLWKYLCHRLHSIGRKVSKEREEKEEVEEYLSIALVILSLSVNSLRPKVV
jgi:hypothetical protein